MKKGPISGTPSGEILSGIGSVLEAGDGTGVRLANGGGKGTIAKTACAGEVMQPTLGPSQSNSAYRRTKMRRVLAWSAVGLWMPFIFYWSSQSSLPGFEQSLLDLLLKKGGHLVMFGLLAGA